MMFRTIGAMAAVVLVLLVSGPGCGGKSENSQAEKPAAAAQPSAGATSSQNQGVWPVSQVDVSTFTEDMATEGARIFESKCTACHKLAERYVGPALAGVTERREPAWIMNMILGPDKMVQQDPTAKQLLAEYLAPMTNQNLTEPQARAVLAYLISQDKK
jgi:cytochrome c